MGMLCQRGMGGEEIVHAARCERMRNERRRCRICAVEDDEHAPCGGTENQPRDTAEFEAADLREDIQSVVWIGTVDIEGTADNLDLMHEALIGDVRAASGDLFGT